MMRLEASWPSMTGMKTSCGDDKHVIKGDKFPQMTNIRKSEYTQGMKQDMKINRTL
jgi:hypothetical protein